MDTISVVGGGIAGLALVAALDPGRFRVVLHEQSPDRPPAGTALAMWPEVMAALERIGAASDVLRDSLLIERLQVADGAHRPIMTTTAQQPQLITRPRLLAALDAAVPASVERVTTRVTDPAKLPGALIVGADGVHSVVRRRMLGGRVDARPVGLVALRGVSPVSTDEMVELWSGGWLCGLSPVAGGGSNWYLAGWADGDPGAIERLDDAQAHDLAVSHAATFGARAREVIAATAPATVLRQQLWVTPARLRVARGRAVLIGDAAHAMCPNLGRGACESILDAVSLGTAINERGISGGVRRYRRERVVRAQGVKAASRAVLALSTVRRGGELRNRVLRALPVR
ncbi:NAD(P)/FAD-dependent oxidoreductase [Blastococcus sp. Marseille-P5729]|uniref:FAD-dependent monooxygenase n=1 Tax=Blastococcus sp. Marseille-P5729 TaxID=2086582 RepID=UPI000D0EACDA|nr:NAD(P)/FAD-dependent oxidoreductase [Blastococcus sp. Marseille-P5729]